MAPVPTDHPLFVAWKRYTETEEYANTMNWLHRGSPTNCEGELWAAFAAGFDARAASHPVGPRSKSEAKRLSALAHPVGSSGAEEECSFCIAGCCGDHGTAADMGQPVAWMVETMLGEDVEVDLFDEEHDARRCCESNEDFGRPSRVVPLYRSGRLSR